MPKRGGGERKRQKGDCVSNIRQPDFLKGNPFISNHQYCRLTVMLDDGGLLTEVDLCLLDNGHPHSATLPKDVRRTAESAFDIRPKSDIPWTSAERPKRLRQLAFFSPKGMTNTNVYEGCPRNVRKVAHLSAI